MMSGLLIVGFGCGLLIAVIYWARLDARKAERLAALKREIKERESVQNVVDTWRHVPIEHIRNRLQRSQRN